MFENYLYLYVDYENCEEWMSDVAPDENQIEMVINDELKVFRIDRSKAINARIEMYEPIDNSDLDSWGEIKTKD